MISIFFVLSLLINASFAQVDIGYNDLQDPAEWTQPGGDDEDEDIPFTSQDFHRHTPEMLKLRQNYVQALWEQILQLQRDLPSDDPRSANNMPWLWQALRDKFNRGGLPNFDFDAIFPRPAVPMPPDVNLKTVMEILKDMYHQSMSPGPDFFDNINRNLHLFNVYYDNRRQFLEEEAGKLLRYLYAQNKGCFRKSGDLASRFEQPLQNAYDGHGFTAEEIQSLMFNIKNIFEGFSELKGNLGVLDKIGKRILSILHKRIQDPRKEQLFGVIRKLFKKYGSALNDPGNFKGSWPSLVVDLLAAVCKAPADLVKFIGNLRGDIDGYNPPTTLSNDIESEAENEVPDNDLQSSAPQTVMKRNAPAKIRRKAPEMSDTAQNQQQLSNNEKNKSSSQFLSSAVEKDLDPESAVKAAEAGHMENFKELSNHKFQPHIAIENLFGLNPDGYLAALEAELASELTLQSSELKKTPRSASDIQNELSPITKSAKPHIAMEKLFGLDPEGYLAALEATLEAESIQPRSNQQMASVSPQHTVDDSRSLAVPRSFRSTLATPTSPAGNVKGYKKRYGSEESSETSKTKKKGRRKSSKQASNISAYKRQLNALQQLQTARSHLLGTSTSSAAFNKVGAAGAAGGGTPGVVASSSGFEGRKDTIEAERTDVHKKLALRERLQAIQAQREKETVEKNEDIEKNTNKSTSKKSGEEEGYEKDEETITPFGLSKGKVKGFKKSTSSETSQSSSTFKKKSSNKAEKVSEKLSSLDREIEQLQEMLSSQEKVKATSERVKGQENAITTMSGSMDMGNPYSRYQAILQQKLKQRAHLIQLLKQLSSATASRFSDFRSARPLAMNPLFRGNQQSFQPEQSNLRSNAYATGREEAPGFMPRLPSRSLPPFSARAPPVANVGNFQMGAYRGAPALGLGPYPLPPQASSFQGQYADIMRNIPQPAQAVYFPSQFMPQNVEYENDDAEQTDDEPDYQNPLANPLATFRSAAGSSTGYSRKYGSEENEASSKTKVRQRKKSKKTAQKMAAKRAKAEASADLQRSHQELAAKTARNKAYENKLRGQEGVNAQEASSKGAESATSELQASKSDLKQTLKAKAVEESVQAEATSEDDESETEIEQSTEKKSAKNYGEESGYSHDYGGVASFKSARQGQSKPFTGYRRQFGSKDNQVAAYQNIGGLNKGGKLAQHIEQYKSNVYSPTKNKIPSQKINRMKGQVPNYSQQHPAIPYSNQQSGFVNPRKSQSQQTNYQAIAPDQSVQMLEQQQLNGRPLAASATTGGRFAQAGGYQKTLPGNGEEVGVQNRYGKFGTFHSAFSSPLGKMGKVKGYKKKFGSETSDESSKVKKKHRKKSSKKAAQMAAARAESSRLAELSSTHQSLLQQQAKNAGFQNKLRGVAGSSEGNPISAVDSESSGFEQQQSMLAASKDQQNLRLQQQAKQEAIQAQATSEDDESETEIEESTSKKTAKNYGEESGYESSFGDTSNLPDMNMHGDLAEFQSARSSRPQRRHRGYNEKDVYLDDLQKFLNQRQYLPPQPPPPQNPYGHFMMGPTVPSGEMSAYKKKYGSESEERGSKLSKKERHRTTTELAKLAASRGEMDSLNEVDQSSAQELEQNADVNAYKNRDSAAMRKRFGMHGNRRDTLNARLHQRAKMYGVQKEIAAKTTESETELEKSAHLKKNKEGGEESGYNQEFGNPDVYGLLPGIKGHAKGFNKNFSKESSEKKSNLKKKSHKKTAKIIAKIREVQREIDLLSELQASREQRFAASGEMTAYSNKGNAAYQSQAAISSELKEIVKKKQRLRQKVSALTKQLAVQKSEASTDIEHSSSEKTSKQTGEESAFDKKFQSGNVAAGNGVTGSSSGYSKKSSSQSSHNSRSGKLKAFQQANSLGVDVTAYNAESDQQLEQEREKLLRSTQAQQVQGAGSALPMPNFSFDGFQPFESIAFPPPPTGQSYSAPNLEEDTPSDTPFLSLADFRSSRNNRQRIGKRGYKKLSRPFDDHYKNLHKSIFSPQRDHHDPMKSMFGNAFSSPLEFGLGEMNEMKNMMQRQLGFSDMTELPDLPELPKLPDLPEMSFGPFTKDKRKKHKKKQRNPQKSSMFRPQQPFSAAFNGMKDFPGNEGGMFSSKVHSADMDGLISGIHKEFDLDGEDVATNTREKSKVLGGFQKQLAVGDDDFFANDLQYAGHNSVSQSPFSKEVSQELSSQSKGVSANSLGFSKKKVSTSSKVFTG